MRSIKLDSVEITRDGKKTKEFMAVFAYEHLEEIAKQLVIEKLKELGEFEGLDTKKGIRVESSYCEPDGDMGYRGSRVKVVLMFGPADYYPRLMEGGESYRFKSKTAQSSILPSELPVGFWARLKRWFR